MKQYSLNLSTIFTEVPFIERFKKAKEQGFSFVECQFPYALTVDEIKRELEGNQLDLVLINLPPGDWERGDRGISIYSDRQKEFKRSVDDGILYATKLGVKTVHCMAGILYADLNREAARKTYIDNLTYAANKMAEFEISLVIEPINTLDMPNYFLSSMEEAIEIIEDIGLSNIKIQYDFYHMQRIQGNLITTFQNYQEYIQHVQIADVPGRNEPGTGEIHFENIFAVLKKLNYQGKIGLEYTPKTKSEASFAWVKKEVK